MGKWLNTVPLGEKKLCIRPWWVQRKLLTFSNFIFLLLTPWGPCISLFGSFFYLSSGIPWFEPPPPRHYAVCLFLLWSITRIKWISNTNKQFSKLQYIGNAFCCCFICGNCNIFDDLKSWSFHTKFLPLWWTVAPELADPPQGPENLNAFTIIVLYHRAGNPLQANLTLFICLQALQEAACCINTTDTIGKPKVPGPYQLPTKPSLYL